MGAEAPVRWERPGHGLGLLRSFLPLAEETRLVVDIGQWVLGLKVVGDGVGTAGPPELRNSTAGRSHTVTDMAHGPSVRSTTLLAAATTLAIAACGADVPPAAVDTADPAVTAATTGSTAPPPKSTPAEPASPTTVAASASGADDAELGAADAVVFSTDDVEATCPVGRFNRLERRLEPVGLRRPANRNATDGDRLVVVQNDVSGVDPVAPLSTIAAGVLSS